MISGLMIGNFKAFGPAQEIPLRPITLVFGPNSAGKSSIIQSLLLARHIQDTGNVDAHQTTLGGAAVDLGGFARYVHCRHTDRETTIRLTFERGEIRGKFEEFGDFKTLALQYSIGKSTAVGHETQEAVAITSATVFLDERARFRLVRNLDGLFCMDIAAMRKRLEERRAELESDEDFGEMIIARWLADIEELTDAKFGIPRLTVRAINPLPKENYDFEEVASRGDLDRPEGDPYGFFSRLFKSWTNEEPKSEVLKAMVRRYEFECLLEAANEVIDRALQSVCYLGPLRWIPPRLVPDGEQFDASWKAGGGDAWQRLRREPELLERVNHFLRESLRTRYRLECQHFARVSSAAALAGNSPSDPLTARVAEDPPPAATKRVQSADETITTLSIVDADTGLTVSHRDVGTGISQLLPVLVNAAGSKERLIAIEQPELHLHPALQSELGDVFIESALGENKNTFLIETHSEHLIRRIMRRIRESNAGRQPAHLPRVRPEDVAILFVQPTESGAVVKHLRVDQQGRLKDDWPGGFFEEAFNELF